MDNYLACLAERGPKPLFLHFSGIPAAHPTTNQKYPMKDNGLRTGTRLILYIESRPPLARSVTRFILR